MKSPNKDSCLFRYVKGGERLDAQHEAAIMIAHDYAEYVEYIFEQRGYSVRDLSYAKSSAAEIIKRIAESPDKPPLVVIEEFRDKMIFYSKKDKPLFVTACETADELMDLFM